MDKKDFKEQLFFFQMCRYVSYYIPMQIDIGPTDG